jgi:hypothetical protein
MMKYRGAARGVKYVSVFVFIFSALILSAASGYAQDAAASPTPSEEEQRLQEEKKIIELKADIAAAKKTIRESVPQPSATPLAGDTTLNEGVRLETEMVSYKAMSAAANLISKEIKKNYPGATNIAIYDAQVVKDWRSYQALFPVFKGQVNDILRGYIEILCSDTGLGLDVNPQFKKKFCEDESSARLADKSNRVTTANLRGDVITEAFAAGTGFLKSFIDLAALFRTETKIEGKQVTIDESALIAELFRALRNDYETSDPKHPITLYYPEVFPPRLNPNQGESGTITKIGILFLYKEEADRIIKKKNKDKEQLAEQIKDALDEKAKLEEELEQVEELEDRLNNLKAALSKETIPIFRRKLWEDILEAQTDLANLKPHSVLEAKIAKLKVVIDPVQAQIKQINANIKPLVALNERFQSFVDQFVKVDSSGVNSLALFIRSEDLERAIEGDQSYWLEIKSVSAGGNNRTRKNLLRYFTGAKLDHSGGIIVEYTLYQKTGAVLSSDKLSFYEGYFEPKKIKDRAKFKDDVQ